MSLNHAFVFAVCGDDEHVETLNFSLRYLKKYSSLPIVIVTDHSRTSATIEHSEVIDVRCPEHFDNHQASIYLKTNLHRILAIEGKRYCYLDSDVLALNPCVDDIFEHKKGPVTFAADHCQVPAFSPSAVFCGCRERFKKQSRELNELIDRFKRFPGWDSPEITAKRKQLHKLLSEWKNIEQKKKQTHPLSSEEKTLNACIREWSDNQESRPDLLAKRQELVRLFAEAGAGAKWVKQLLFKIWPKYRRGLFSKEWKDREGNVIINEYALSLSDFVSKRINYTVSDDGKFWLSPSGKEIKEVEEQAAVSFKDFFSPHGFLYDLETGIWSDIQGNTVIYKNVIPDVERESSYRFDYKEDVWKDDEGREVFNEQCEHLQEAIQTKFQVEIAAPNWQHWNGGVFLFDEESLDFLDNWHKWTIQCFDDPEWRTRDQGTLIATVWKMGLQDNPLLPVRYNLIADYYSQRLKFKPNKGFSEDEFQTVINPCFAHIYHHWGDEGWDVWQWLLTQL